MRKLFFISYCLLSNMLASAQPTLTWAENFTSGTSASDMSYCVTLDGNDNVYTTGYFTYTTDFDPGAGTFNLTSVGERDIYVSKLDASGNFVWAKRMGGTFGDQAKSIATDASGNVYITGTFIGTADFDPGTGTFNLTSAGGGDIFVCKLSSTGNFVWAKRIGGVDIQLPNSIAVDGIGNVHITGYFKSTCDFDPGPGAYNLTASGSSDIFICKLDNSGNFLWTASIGGTNIVFAGSTDVGYSIAIDGSGNVITTGGFLGTVDFDPGAGIFNLTASGTSDAFISKLDASGNFVWAKQIDASGANRSVAIDGNSNIYVAGALTGTSDFDPGPGIFNLTSVGGQDICVYKLDALGNFIWANNVGGNASDYANSIALDASNYYIMGDFYNGTLDLDPSAGTFNIANLGTEANFVGKYDFNGNFVCGFSITPEHNETVSDRHLVVDGSNNVYVTAWFDNPSADFDACTGTSILSNPNFWPKGYIAKYNFGSCNCTLVLPIQLLSFTARSNGSNNLLHWETSNEINNDYFTLESSIDSYDFEEIGKVNGAGNSSSLLSYQLVDDNPFYPITYYRLKQTDYDGKFEYSNILVIKSERNKDRLIANIWPNPFNNKFKIQFSAKAKYPINIEITDYLGRKRYKNTIKNEIPSVEIDLDSQFPSGAYFVKIFNNSEYLVRKMIKE